MKNRLMVINYRSNAQFWKKAITRIKPIFINELVGETINPIDDYETVIKLLEI